MIDHIRTAFNDQFSEAKYQSLLDDIEKTYRHRPPFKISETPVFLPKNLNSRLLEACEEINDVLVQPNFKELTSKAIEPKYSVPGEDEHTIFLQMDFGICRDEKGDLIPQLIEIQGFPSLYFYQDVLAQTYRKYYSMPDKFTHLFDGLTSEDYMKLLRKIIVGHSKVENIVLLEVEPEKQTTRIDFLATEHHLGIKTLNISDLKKEGKDVYYLDANGRKTGVEKILNRVIFDELVKRDDLKRQFHFTEEINAKWIGHPHWFFRISKYTLPLLKSKYVPETHFLSNLAAIPDDLNHYVLKPLYSFAGTGVIINLNRHDINMIEDKENYIIQKKVQYEPVVETLDEPAKCEIRMLMLWEEGAERPQIVNNLVRLSKGEMIGVRYNKNKTWVGGSIGLFERE